jgi:hypothetical protein
VRIVRETGKPIAQVVRGSHLGKVQGVGLGSILAGQQQREWVFDVSTRA